MPGWGEVLEAEERPVVYTVVVCGESKEAGVAGVKWARGNGGTGGGESRERTGREPCGLWGKLGLLLWVRWEPQRVLSVEGT